MKRNIILASGSPRRKELLAMLTEEFEICVSDCEEIITSSDPATVTMELSRQKAEAVAKTKSDNCVIIGADTVVALDGEILGKPSDKKVAFDMINMLQGNTHQVYTGVTIVCWQSGKYVVDSFAECTNVKVAVMTEDEIEYYVNTPEPYDKAGAYGIQGVFGKYVESIEGDYNNVVGLPVHKLYKRLELI